MHSACVKFLMHFSCNYNTISMRVVQALYQKLCDSHCRRMLPGSVKIKNHPRTQLTTILVHSSDPPAPAANSAKTQTAAAPAPPTTTSSRASPSVAGPVRRIQSLKTPKPTVFPTTTLQAAVAPMLLVVVVKQTSNSQNYRCPRIVIY